MKKIYPIFVLLFSIPCYACGPWYPYSFIENNGQGCYPKIVFREELTLMAEKYIKGLEQYSQFKRSNINSQEADEKDFIECINSLKSRGMLEETEKRKILRRYINYSKLCRKGKECSFDYPPELKKYFLEFILYLEGVKNLRSSSTLDPWYDLLKLPEKQRKYRTTWVLYMLGNIESNDIDKALGYYERLRKSVMKGYIDTQGLAYASFKRDFIAQDSEDTEKRFYYGLRAWKYYSQNGGIKNSYSRYIYSTLLTEAQLSNHKKNLKEKLKSRLIRDVLSARALSIGTTYADKLLLNLKDLEINQGDKLAFLAYSEGNIDLTKKWLEITPEDSFLGRWLRAELARREGKYDKASEHYHLWLKSFKEANEKGSLKHAENVYFNQHTEAHHAFHQHVYGQLGTTSIHRRDFLEAMHCFMMAGSWVDVAYIADYILDSDEVETYYLQFQDKPEFFCSMEKEKKAISGNGHYRMGLLYHSKANLLVNFRHLLARRFMREKNYKKALKYYPENLKKIAKEYLGYLNKSKDKRDDINSRGLALYNAAKLMRHHGMELVGSEGYPDTFGFVLGINIHKNMPVDLQSKREENDTPKPFRYHYRHVAASMMMEAAEMSTDKNLKIMAYYVGGKWIAPQHPYIADPFYKKLVRLRHTPLSDDADTIRWFPNGGSDLIDNEFTDCQPVPSLDFMKEIVDSYSEVVVYE